MKIKTVYVETTNICNLNCRTCYNRSGINKICKEMTKNDLEHIIDLFSPFGLSRFLISGGEPTLHSEFDKILDLADEYANLSFGIVTNGTNLHEKLIHMLNTRENITVQISLDGSNEEYNCKTRGNGNFEKVINFASKIKNKSANPLLKMVISQNNYDDIENFYALALSLDFTPEFAFIFKSGNGSDGWDTKALTPQQKIKALNLIESLNKKTGHEAFLPMPTSKCPFTNGLDDLSLCIKVEGNIQPCQMLYSEEYSLGNIYLFDYDSFEVNLDKIVNIAKTRYRFDYGCKKCLINGYCGKGCIGTAVNLHDDPFTDDGDCEFRKLELISHQLRGEIQKHGQK